MDIPTRVTKCGKLIKQLAEKDEYICSFNYCKICSPESYNGEMSYHWLEQDKRNSNDHLFSDLDKKQRQEQITSPYNNRIIAFKEPSKSIRIGYTSVNVRPKKGYW